eukprot:6556731-Pyramimonas_sp.AAC.1
MWPWQLLCSLVMLAPKPGKGDRALALLPQLVRCWERLHMEEVKQWAKAQQRDWDAAVTGNSCLREAMRRIITDECCDALQIFQGCTLADIEKLYDSLRVDS